VIGRTFIIIFLWLFILPPFSYAAGSGDSAPLSLLKDPQQSSQTAQNQNINSQNHELRDIHGPVSIKEQPPYLLIAGVILLLLLLLALAYWFFKKKAKPAPPPVPPWEKALLELADAKMLLNPERGLLYMDRVSQILRSYIESRFAIQSTRQTTREFLQGLTGVDDSSPLQTFKTELQECLEQADMAKFAHHLPKLENLEQMELAVTSFIKRTEPTEPGKRGKS
jgi:hypothetical protein